MKDTLSLKGFRIALVLVAIYLVAIGVITTTGWYRQTRVTGELDHDNQVQTWTYRRDQANLCLTQHERYEGSRRAVLIGQEALIAIAENPDPVRVERYRQEVQRRIDEAYPQPKCDRNEAAHNLEIAVEQLEKLGV